jgi:hypothetical protein
MDDPYLQLFLFITFLVAGITTMGLGALLRPIISRFRRSHDESE